MTFVPMDSSPQILWGQWLLPFLRLLCWTSRLLERRSVPLRIASAPGCVGRREVLGWGVGGWRAEP